MNPPDIYCPDGDWNNFSHRISIFLDNASNVAVNSCSTIVGHLKTVRKLDLLSTSGEWNCLIVAACKFSNFYLFMVFTFRSCNPVLPNIYSCGGNWNSC